MKKSLLYLLLGLFTSIASATTQIVGNFTLTYSISNNEATITACSDSSGALEIPSTLGGYPVTTIGCSAFYDCRSLTSVTIPSSVTTIGDYAFYFCESLTSVTIPEGVTTIGDYAFYFCYGLTAVTIPEGVISIGEEAFGDCWGLSSVTILEGVTTIGGGAFSGCTSLTSVTIPEGVTTIGYSAFYGCSSLPKDENGVQYESDAKFVLIEVPTSLSGNFVIPNSVRYIHSSAFHGCSGLTSVTIPSSVTTIGDNAFYECSNLPKDENGVQYESEAKVVLIEVPTSVSGNFVIPNSVRFIASETFADYRYDSMYSVTSVTIPASVISVGTRAFGVGPSLTSFIVDSTNQFFSSISGLLCSKAGKKLVAVPGGLTSVKSPDGVTSIGEWAFYKCNGLTSVEIPDGVISIGEWAFSDCDSLTSVLIPSSVIEIKEGAFANCLSLTNVYFGGVPPTTDGYSKFGANISTSIMGYYLPEYASEWEAVIDADGKWNGLTMQVYDDSAIFSYSITNGEVTITGLNDEEYSGAITIPSTLDGYPVTTIGWAAFGECSGLTSVTIPSSVTSIEYYAFSRCSSLMSFIVDKENQYYSSINSLLCSKDGKTLIACPGGVTSVTIPSSLTSIGEAAFLGCSSLMSFIVGEESQSYRAINGLLCSKDGKTFVACPGGLTAAAIPSGVTTIGYSAFEGCLNLVSVEIPSSVMWIEDYAFVDCSSLMSVTIPEGVTSIGVGGFAGCSSLMSVTIPEGVTEIGYSAFANCSALTSVDFKGKPPRVVYESTDYPNSPVFPSATGTYLPEYASEWEAVIDADGKWQGLTMSCKVSKFPVEVAVNGEGSVTGAGAYAPGDSVTLTATPNEGFVFCGWSEPSAKSATYSFTMPEKAVSLTAYFAPKAAVTAYVAMNNLMSKDEAVQEALDADEVFTADEMKALALGAPVIQVKDGKVTVSIQVQQASELDGEWEVVEDGEVSVEITPKASEKAGFYKFVVPNQQ